MACTHGVGHSGTRAHYTIATAPTFHILGTRRVHNEHHVLLVGSHHHNSIWVTEGADSSKVVGWKTLDDHMARSSP